MAKQNSVNLDITNNADGFSIAGGSTSRTLGVSGADITLVGSGSATITFPTTSTTLAGLGITQTFTALQSFSTGISASGGVTFASATIGLSNANPTINASNSIFNIKATQPIGNQPANVLLTLQGADIDTGGVPRATLKIQDSLGGAGQIHLDANAISGVVGITGAVAIKGSLSTTGNMTSTGLIIGSAGVCCAGITASGGICFNAATVYITNTSAVDPLYVQHLNGSALKVATTGQARSGAIKLGNSTTPTFNTFISQTDGTLTVYNGFSATGGNILSASATSVNVGVTVSGATFSGLLRSSSGISAELGICGGTYMSAAGGYRFTSTAIKALTGTTYTLLTSDDGKILTSSNASLQKFEIPTGLPVGFNCSVIQLGTGTVGFSAAGGVTINSFGGKTLMAGQYAAVSIIEYATNILSISGGLTT